MVVNKYYRDGKESVEIVRGRIATSSYFRFCLILTVSFTLVYSVILIIGYGYERWIQEDEALATMGHYMWIVLYQFLGTLISLLLAYPGYRLLERKFSSQIFVFSGEKESDL